MSLLTTAYWTEDTGEVLLAVFALPRVVFTLGIAFLQSNILCMTITPWPFKIGSAAESQAQPRVGVRAARLGGGQYTTPSRTVLAGGSAGPFGRPLYSQLFYSRPLTLTLHVVFIWRNNSAHTQEGRRHSVRLWRPCSTLSRDEERLALRGISSAYDTT